MVSLALVQKSGHLILPCGVCGSPLLCLLTIVLILTSCRVRLPFASTHTRSFSLCPRYLLVISPGVSCLLLSTHGFLVCGSHGNQSDEEAALFSFFFYFSVWVAKKQFSESDRCLTLSFVSFLFLALPKKKVLPCLKKTHTRTISFLARPFKCANTMLVLVRQPHRRPHIIVLLL